MNSHSYKFICSSCGAIMDGETEKEMDVLELCFCGKKTMEMTYHMWPNGEYWMTKELSESIDD